MDKVSLNTTKQQGIIEFHAIFIVQLERNFNINKYKFIDYAETF